MMSDPDQTVMQTANGGRGRPRRLAAFDDFTFGEDQPADVATGLVSLGYIGAAIRRSARFWCVMALVGMAVGLGYYLKSPPAYKASTSVLLTYGPDESPASAVFDNQAIAESHTVAQLAMKKLGDNESIGSFAASYTVAIVTDRVLLITVHAPTSSQAVSRAGAIATAFLQFRANQEKAAQQMQVAALDQEVTQARQNVSIFSQQVSELQAQGGPADKLKSLQDKLQQAQITLGVIQQTAASAQAGASAIQARTGSVVLDPAAPLSHSRIKGMLTYALYGLIAGLAIGIGIVAVRAVISNRLRRRDDVARALGAPVKLSVGPVRLNGRLPGSRRGLEAAGNLAVKRIVAHLRGVVSARDGKTALTVISVDDPGVAALSVVSLATSYAAEGRRVVLADLAAGAPAAALLDSTNPGVSRVGTEKAQLVLAVPDSDELAPVGPVGRIPKGSHPSEFTEQVRSAFGSADLVLTVATLDPSLGAEHLQSWAPSAVAMVTAGKASWTKIHAAGEMIRLSGTSLVSAILIGADKADETVGVVADSESLLGVGELN